MFSEENLQYQQVATKYEAVITNYRGSDCALKAQKNLAITCCLDAKADGGAEWDRKTLNRFCR
jgi:hypothetical protein